MLQHCKVLGNCLFLQDNTHTHTYTYTHVCTQTPQTLNPKQPWITLFLVTAFTAFNKNRNLTLVFNKSSMTVTVTVTVTVFLLSMAYMHACIHSDILSRASSKGQAPKGKLQKASSKGQAPKGKLQRASSKGQAPKGKLQKASSKGQAPKGKLQRASSKWHEQPRVCMHVCRTASSGSRHSHHEES